MTAKVISKITIKSSPANVFKYLSDTKFHYLWNPHLQSLTPEIKLKKGSTYNSTSLFLGVRLTNKNTVTKYIVDRELQLENNTGTVKYIANYLLTKQDESTRLVCTTIVSANSNTFAFTLPILKVLARRELQNDLSALKIAIEYELG